jgi:hypothetical protein
VIGIVLGIDTAIKKKKENATETKIVEKGTAIETVTVTATGIGIDIVEMTRTVTGRAGKNETPPAAMLLQVLPPQLPIAGVFLLALLDIETCRMATKVWGRGEGLLMMSPTGIPNVVLVRIAIGTNGVDGRLKRRVMKGLANPTDAEQIVTVPITMVVGLKGPVISAFLKAFYLPRRYPRLLLLRHEPWRQAILPVVQNWNQLPHVIAIGSLHARLLLKEAPTRLNNRNQNWEYLVVIAVEAFTLV